MFKRANGVKTPPPESGIPRRSDPLRCESTLRAYGSPTTLWTLSRAKLPENSQRLVRVEKVRRRVLNRVREAVKLNGLRTPHLLLSVLIHNPVSPLQVDSRGHYHFGYSWGRLGSRSISHLTRPHSPLNLGPRGNHRQYPRPSTR